MTRREWFRLIVVMAALVALGIYLVFSVGAGTPTRRS